MGEFAGPVKKNATPKKKAPKLQSQDVIKKTVARKPSLMDYREEGYSNDYATNESSEHFGYYDYDKGLCIPISQEVVGVADTSTNNEILNESNLSLMESKMQELDAELEKDFNFIVSKIDEGNYSDADEEKVIAILKKWAYEKFTTRPDVYPNGGQYLNNLFSKLTLKSKDIDANQRTNYYSLIFQNFHRVEEVKQLRDKYTANFKSDNGIKSQSFFGYFWDEVKNGNVEQEIYAYFNGLIEGFVYAGVGMVKESYDRYKGLYEGVHFLLYNPEKVLESIAELPGNVVGMFNNRDKIWSDFVNQVKNKWSDFANKPPTEQAKIIGTIFGELELNIYTRGVGKNAAAKIVSGKAAGKAVARKAAGKAVARKAAGKAVARKAAGKAAAKEAAGKAVAREAAGKAVAREAAGKAAARKAVTRKVAAGKAIARKVAAGKGGARKLAYKGRSKTGPKPFGTGPHNKKIAEVASQVKDGKIIAGGQILPEKAIPTPGGIKNARRPDILVQKPDGSIYGINVGKTTSTGAPSKREIQAIYDLEDAGIPMHFVPYFK